MNQRLVDLNRFAKFDGENLGQLKFTIAQFFRINGESTHSTGRCTGEYHHVHCCKAKGNKTCSPEDWRVLYQQREPEWEDVVRRKWMTRWMSGRMKLHEAVLAYEEEWGSCEAGERRVAA